MGARSRNLNFDLSYDMFIALIIDKCHYCGALPKNTCILKTTLCNAHLGGRTFYYNGIDRKDSSLGYTEDNCVTCCTYCNFSKRSMPYDDFIMWLDYLVKFRTNLIK